MLERPDLADEIILNCLEKRYQIRPRAFEFLPVGYDASAWAFRAEAINGKRYFLKLHQGSLAEDAAAPAGVLIPRALNELGLEAVVAALPDLEGKLVQPLDGYWLALYPYIEGENAMQKGLSPAQWQEYGRFVQALHTAHLPRALKDSLPRERFQPAWAGMVRRIQAGLRQGLSLDPIAAELADFWQEHEAEIDSIMKRTEALGEALRQRKLETAICHADIHTANLLVDEQDKLFVVDWDGVCLAPRERDLMFVVEDASLETGPCHPQQRWFFEGYSAVQIDRMSLAYYRGEWAVQEIGDFGERVFLAKQGGDLTRMDSVQGFKQLFEPGDVMEAAYKEA